MVTMSLRYRTIERSKGVLFNSLLDLVPCDWACAMRLLLQMNEHKHDDGTIVYSVIQWQREDAYFTKDRRAEGIVCSDKIKTRNTKFNDFFSRTTTD